MSDIEKFIDACNKFLDTFCEELRIYKFLDWLNKKLGE